MSSQEEGRSRIPVQWTGFMIVLLFILLFAIVFLLVRWVGTLGIGLGEAWPFLLVLPAVVFGLALAFNVVVRLVKGPKAVLLDEEE